MNGLHSVVTVALVILLCTSGGQGRSFKGPCTKSGSNMPGAFKFQCSRRGFFNVVQRHGSTGYSWCVNPETGLKVENSDVAPGNEGPVCGKCLQDLDKFLNDEHTHTFVGRQKPSCDDNGRFNALQIHPSSGYSWCVDRETGIKIQGSEVSSYAGRANCDFTGFRGPCKVVGKVRPGAYQQQCTENGYFQIVQRHGSTGYSWCVNPETGVKVEASVRGPGSGDPQCGKCHHALDTFLSAGLLVGNVKPSCDEDGNYKAFQSSASSGYTWCVDRITGEKIEGSEVGPAAGSQANCEAAPAKPQGPCEAEIASIKPMFGTFIPKCDTNGFYASIQEHEGHKFCVNTSTGEVIPTSQSGDSEKLPCEN